MFALSRPPASRCTFRGKSETMKESAKELAQMRERCTSPQLADLRWALRLARRNLYMEGAIGEKAEAMLQGLDVDHSRLVADIDGDAPDEGVLDWRWDEMKVKPFGEGADARKGDTQAGPDGVAAAAVAEPSPPIPQHEEPDDVMP